MSRFPSTFYDLVLIDAQSLADEIENDPTFEWEEDDDGEPEVLNFNLDFEVT